MPNFITKYHHYDKEKHLKIVTNGKWVLMRKYKGRQGLWDGGVSIGKKLGQLPWRCPTDDQSKVCTGFWSPGRDGQPHIVDAPDRWLDPFPKGMPLCGEMWMDDDEHALSKIVTIKNPDCFQRADWSLVKFVPFNIMPYEVWVPGNAQFQSSYWTKAKKYCKILGHMSSVCKDKVFEFPTYIIIRDEGDIISFQTTCKDEGWEGLIFANGEGRYTTADVTDDILKYKITMDCECTVMGWTPGTKGKRLDGMVGALIVQTDWGENVASMIGGSKDFVGKRVTYEVSGGLNDETRDWETCQKVYPVGKELTLTFNGLTKYGKPQHARIVTDETKMEKPEG